MMSDTIEELIGQVDICFVFDTTSSMSPYIDEAKRRAKEILETEAAKGDLDIRVAIVEYRDHPPQDVTFVTRLYPFMNTDEFQNTLNGLYAAGGGDMPEAVWDGLVVAGRDLQWREYADKLCFLIGDSPPHGYGGISQWPDGCPCKATAGGIVEIFGSKRIKIHAISIAGQPETTKAFREVADPTDGSVEEVLTAAESSYTYEAKVHSTSVLTSTARAYYMAASASPTSTASELASTLGSTADAVTGAFSYLRSRGFDVSKFEAAKGEDDMNKTSDGDSS